jgi:hypothetical protein
MFTPPQSKELVSVSIRPMRELDLAEAHMVFRIAFGTFVGAPRVTVARHSGSSRTRPSRCDIGPTCAISIFLS